MDMALIAEVTGVLLLLAWVVWHLWAVNWKRLAPVLAQGGWAPAVLLLLIAAFAWSRLDPVPCTCLPGVVLPNVVWQLAAVAGLAAVALFCGWLQGRLGWAPRELTLDPPDAYDDGHAHAH
jgi:hypothetical protein